MQPMWSVSTSSFVQLDDHNGLNLMNVSGWNLRQYKDGPVLYVDFVGGHENQRNFTEPQQIRTFLQAIGATEPCLVCDGTGEIDYEPEHGDPYFVKCDSCNGMSRVLYGSQEVAQ